MMPVVESLKISYIFIIFIISLLGGIIPIYLSQKYSLHELLLSPAFMTVKCFSTGVILGVAVMHLLADAIETLSVVSSYPLGLLITLGGVLLALGVDQLALYLLTKDGPKHELVVHCCDEPSHLDHSHSCEDHGHGGEFGQHTDGHSHGHGHDENLSTNDHGHDCISHGADFESQYQLINQSKQNELEMAAINLKKDNDNADTILGTESDLGRMQDVPCVHVNVPHEHHACSIEEKHVHHTCNDNAVDINNRRFKHDDCRRTLPMHGATRAEARDQNNSEKKAKHSGHSHGPDALGNVKGVSAGTLVTKAYILEAAISTHTILIGFGFGSLGNSDVMEIKVLMAAFAFHQFFEGISMGTALSGASVALGKTYIYLLLFLFAITFDIGIILGMFAVSSGSSIDTTQGAATAVAAGILIHSSMVEMIPDDFTSEVANNNPWLKVYMYIALSAGIAVMAVIAVWA